MSDTGETDEERGTETRDERPSRVPPAESGRAETSTEGEEAETPTESDPVVVAEGVRRTFGDLTVLSGVTFGAERGTVNCFVGPNGSGKTTLLRILAGLLAPSDGGVTVGSDGSVGDGTAGGRVVGYLPQTPSFRPQFTLAETLSFYSDLAGIDVDADAVLSRVGLDPVADRRMGDLSGGMTRLFGIAQATVGDPPVLVLDEPSSGLDPTMTEHVGSVIRDLADDGHTVVLATHELGTVDRVGDTVLVLDDGVVQVADSPAGLRRETGAGTLTHAVTEYLVGDADGLTVRSGSFEGDGREDDDV